jgi:hypothetical protein
MNVRADVMSFNNADSILKQDPSMPPKCPAEIDFVQNICRAV